MKIEAVIEAVSLCSFILGFISYVCISSSRLEMSARQVKCPHVSNIPRGAQAEIDKAKEVSICKECGSPGPNLWICLHKDCFKVGCGEAHGDHSTLHNRVSKYYCSKVHFYGGQGVLIRLF